MDKFCIKCNEQLIVGQNCTESQLKYHNYRCKSCRSTYDKKYVKDNPGKYNQRVRKYEDGYHRVYLLPEEDYVGVTYNMYRRLNEHEHGLKRNINGWRVLYKDKSREACLELEELLHDMGYKGRINYYK